MASIICSYPSPTRQTWTKTFHSGNSSLRSEDFGVGKKWPCYLPQGLPRDGTYLPFKGVRRLSPRSLTNPEVQIYHSLSIVYKNFNCSPVLNWSHVATGYYLEKFWQADLGYIGQAIIGVKVPNTVVPGFSALCLSPWKGALNPGSALNPGKFIT